MGIKNQNKAKPQKRGQTERKAIQSDIPVYIKNDR
jgi:hypothetical protein